MSDEQKEKLNSFRKSVWCHVKMSWRWVISFVTVFATLVSVVNLFIDNWNASEWPLAKKLFAPRIGNCKVGVAHSESGRFISWSYFEIIPPRIHLSKEYKVVLLLEYEGGIVVDSFSYHDKAGECVAAGIGSLKKSETDSLGFSVVSNTSSTGMCFAIITSSRIPEGDTCVAYINSRGTRTSR